MVGVEEGVAVTGVEEKVAEVMVQVNVGRGVAGAMVAAGLEAPGRARAGRCKVGTRDAASAGAIPNAEGGIACVRAPRIAHLLCASGHTVYTKNIVAHSALRASVASTIVPRPWPCVHSPPAPRVVRETHALCVYHHCYSDATTHKKPCAHLSASLSCLRPCSLSTPTSRARPNGTALLSSGTR